MTNAEKYKTEAERDNAWFKYCSKQAFCRGCPAHAKYACQFRWLELEAEEEN